MCFKIDCTTAVYVFQFVDKDCCGEPDIQLTANCTTNKYVQLKWTSRPSRFGFCVRYYCNADDSVDYCLATEVHIYSSYVACFLLKQWL